MEVSQAAVCRICYSGENSGPKSGEPLISPCHCKGTMGLYHRECLKKWLLSSSTRFCEICGFCYEFKSKPRSFFDYLNSKEALAERRMLRTDFLCFFVLTTLVFLSVTICVSFAIDFQYYINDDGSVASNYGISACLLLMSFILLFIYCAWLIITIIFHRKSFLHWQQLYPDFDVTDQLTEQDSMLVNNGACNNRRVIIPSAPPPSTPFIALRQPAARFQRLPTASLELP